MPTSHRNIIISGVHMELTEALKNIVTEKLEKLFRHQERIMRIRVELILEHHKEHKNEFIAQGHIDMYGPSIIATVASDNEYKSIDLLVDKLDRKLMKRARLSRCKRKHISRIDLPAALPKAVAL